MNTLQTGITEKTIPAFEARRHFGKLLDEVSKDHKFVVEVRGQAVAALVPLKIYQKWKKDRETFFSLMEEAAENASLPPEEADSLAAEAVQAVRTTDTNRTA